MHADEKEKIHDLEIELAKLSTELKAVSGKDSGTKFEDIKTQRSYNFSRCM
jgi:hypothetical protein